MRAYPWLTYGCVEIGNANRTLTYVRRLGIPHISVTACTDSVHPDPMAPSYLCCYCDAVSEDNYVSPAGDDAPWYDSTKPESGEFYGLSPNFITIDPSMARAVSPRNTGAMVGRLRKNQRVVAVEGDMFASTARGMAYGERWLSEVLSGSLCADGCAADELCILPSCPPDGDADPERYFRTLKEAGIIDGPAFSQRSENPNCTIQRVDFQMVSGLPYLFGPEVEVLDVEPFSTGADANGLAQTSDWIGRATLIIEVEAVTDMTDVVIQGKVSLDASCPVTGLADDVMPDFVYRIPALEKGAKWRVDATRRRVEWIDPSRKIAQSGMSQMTFDGPFVWPDVPPCTNLCVTFSSTGDGLATVKQVDTEL